MTPVEAVARKGPAAVSAAGVYAYQTSQGQRWRIKVPDAAAGRHQARG